MQIRVVSWNMNHQFRRGDADAQWAYLASLKPTIALVQEAPARGGPDGIIRREIIGRGFYTGIVAYDGTTLA